MLRVANSTPMVDLLSRLNSLRVNRESRLDFPTPESPMSTTEGGSVSGMWVELVCRRGVTFEKELSETHC